MKIGLVDFNRNLFDVLGFFFSSHSISIQFECVDCSNEMGNFWEFTSTQTVHWINTQYSLLCSIQISLHCRMFYYKIIEFTWTWFGFFFHSLLWSFVIGVCVCFLFTYSLISETMSFVCSRLCEPNSYTARIIKSPKIVYSYLQLQQSISHKCACDEHSNPTIKHSHKHTHAHRERPEFIIKPIF